MPPRRVRQAYISEEVSENQDNQGMNQEGNQNERQEGQRQNVREQQPENPFNMFMEFLRQHINVAPEPNRNQNLDAPNNTVAGSFKAFQSLRPPEFKGTSDPVEARAWLKEMEKYFEILQIAEK